MPVLPCAAGGNKKKFPLFSFLLPVTITRFQVPHPLNNLHSVVLCVSPKERKREGVGWVTGLSALSSNIDVVTVTSGSICISSGPNDLLPVCFDVSKLSRPDSSPTSTVSPQQKVDFFFLPPFSSFCHLSHRVGFVILWCPTQLFSVFFVEFNRCFRFSSITFLTPLRDTCTCFDNSSLTIDFPLDLNSESAVMFQ